MEVIFFEIGFTRVTKMIPRSNAKLNKNITINMQKSYKNKKGENTLCERKKFMKRAADF